MVGCSPIKRLEKAVNKVGVKESIEHLTEKYPEYFSIRYKDVVVTNIDTIFVQEKDGTIVTNVIHDTIYFKDKNLEFKINKTTGKGNYKLPKDTIVEYDTVKVNVATKCPEVFIWTDKIKALELRHTKYKNNTTLTIVILTFLLLLSIIVFLFKFLK